MLPADHERGPAEALVAALQSYKSTSDYSRVGRALDEALAQDQAAFDAALQADIFERVSSRGLLEASVAAFLTDLAAGADASARECSAGGSDELYSDALVTTETWLERRLRDAPEDTLIDPTEVRASLLLR